MAQNKDSAVIYVDTANNTLHYYASSQNRIIHDTRKIASKLFSEEYYEKVKNAISEFVSKYTPTNSANTTIVVPDNVVFTNIVTFPNFKSGELKNSIDTYLSTTYKNLSDLKINSYNIVSNKRSVTVSLTGINNQLVFNLKKACTEARLVAQNVTFAANASICALNSLSGKFKNGTYLFLDIKESYSRFVIVIKGKIIGFYSLKIGKEILENTKLASEDVLLYQPGAELVVLNAREKAKQKALTMSSADNVIENAETEEEEDEEKSFTENVNMVAERQIEVANKVLPKKVARKLPKYMLREVPEDDEHKIYENFRLFIKWTLDIINSNEKIISLGNIDTVYVNLPSDYDYLFDIVNEELEENGVKFVSCGLGNEKEEVYSNLELYGGFFVNSTKQSTKF